MFLNLFEEQTTVQDPWKNFRSFANSATRSVACGVFQIYRLKIISILSNVELAQSGNQLASRYTILTAAGSNLRNVFFYVFIKFSSSVHLLLLFLNLFEGQTTVQNPLKNIRSCASSTTRDVAYILKNYHIRASSVGG